MDLPAARRIRWRRLLFHSVMGFFDFLFHLFHDPHNGIAGTFDTSFHQFVFRNKVARGFPRRLQGLFRLGADSMLSVQFTGSLQCLLGGLTRSFHHVMFLINNTRLFLCRRCHVSHGPCRVTPGIVSLGSIRRTKPQQ